MNAKHWVLVILGVAVAAFVFIITAHAEEWPDSDLGDLWFVGFAVAVAGVVWWYFHRKADNSDGGGR